MQVEVKEEFSSDQP